MMDKSGPTSTIIFAIVVLIAIPIIMFIILRNREITNILNLVTQTPAP